MFASRDPHNSRTPQFVKLLCPMYPATFLSIGSLPTHLSLNPSTRLCYRRSFQQRSTSSCGWNPGGVSALRLSASGECSVTSPKSVLITRSGTQILSDSWRGDVGDQTCETSARNKCESPNSTARPTRLRRRSNARGWILSRCFLRPRPARARVLTALEVSARANARWAHGLQLHTQTEHLAAKPTCSKSPRSCWIWIT